MKRRLTWLLLACLCTASAARAQQGLLTEWVQLNPFFEIGKIALGYPPPIPVDTPLPFDGFRTYAGLHTRHQDLAATTPWVHAEQIGATRAGRTIWAYRLGDADTETIYGLPEPAMLTNGGIHAREWQSPETVTGILELLALHEQDNHFYDYLRDNVNAIVIPSLNIDGFLQTQRYPTLNYLEVDPNFPDTSPRDGRMRRKNMLEVDENLATQFDMLNGVDLNRNNAPYWNTNPTRSSSDLLSLVHHGAAPASEPETQALDAAAQLGPIDRLRLYTDIHSFSQVHFWVRNDNDRLARQTEEVLGTFTGHHLAFPAGKWYAFADRFSIPRNQGIGSTDEYFTHTYQVPSWTLEIEPSNGQSFHAPLPGCGADYGGEANNCHDGFILPDSEIRRVREQLAQSFAATYYRQAGPPSLQALRIVDMQHQAVVYEAEWDVQNPHTRRLHEQQIQPLQLDRPYSLWIAFNKPMRWRADGVVVAFPGQTDQTLDVNVSAFAGDTVLGTVVQEAAWVEEPGDAPRGYLNYADDALFVDFTIPASAENLALVSGETGVNLRIQAFDMTGMQLDANPATVADWENGRWIGYEDGLGAESDFGGADSMLDVPVTDASLEDPFLLEPGIASAWFDLSHQGEGFIIEMLANGLVVMFWFTYDGDGNQDWYISVGEARGNRILFERLLRVSGGVFGPDFDPAAVTEESVGSASFTFTGCDAGTMDWRIGNRRGRQSLQRLTHLMGLDCGVPMFPPIREEARYSGSWFDPTHNGEGFTVQVLRNEAVLVYWFSFGPDGSRRWFFGVGEIVDGKLVFDNMLTTRGGVFGDDFDPATVEELPWGSLELDVTCAGGTASYSSTEEGFGAGQLNVIKLTSMDGLDCAD